MRRFAPLAIAIAAAGGCGSGHRAMGAAPTPEALPFAAAPIAPRSTFCNPLDIDYRFMQDGPSRRDAADPVIALFDGEYYLFASKSGGYWHSRDFRDWQLVVPEGLPAEDDAPAILVLGDRMYYTSQGSMALYATENPLAGKWRKVADLASYAEPAFFLDDDGRVYLYHDSPAGAGISVVELDPRNDFKVIGAPRELLHGSDVEAPWMTKHDGTYYLQYSMPGPVPASHADEVQTSRSPTGGFTAASYSPFRYAAGGFTGGAGRAATFRDRAGNDWRVATLLISTTGAGERRLGIFPTGFDSAGTMRTTTFLGDYPQLLPGAAADPLDRNGTGWMLLSASKQATASSSLPERDADLAFDGDVRSWWSAATGGVGEWLSVDLGRIEHVTALQINFAEEGARMSGRGEDSYQQYVIESSLDGAHWTTRLDEAQSTRDAPHRYVQLDTARNARFVRITNVHAAAGANFAIRELRVFGQSAVPSPPAVQDVAVQRQADGRSAAVSWTRSPGAIAYVIRFGLAPDKLYSSHEAGDVATLTIDSLRPGVTYWFAVDAVGEGGVTRGRERKSG